MATSKGTDRRRQYTEAERAAAVTDAEEMGQAAAGRKHGVPQATLSHWQRRARAAAVEQDEVASDTPAAAPPTSTAEAASPTPTRDPQATRAPATTRKQGKRVVKRYTPSQRAEAVEHAAAHGVSAASEALGISRFSIYEWQRRVEAAGRGEGEDPTSGPSQSDVETQRDREILGLWKKHAGLGPSQIRNQLRRGGVTVSVKTVRRVMEDAGYRPPKIKRDPHHERYESVRPNHRWHMDFVHRHIHKTGTWTLILIDDYSRFVVGHGVDDAERASMVIQTFEQAVARYGKPERVMHDKGSAFWSWRGVSKFTALLTEMEIDQEAAEHKEHNGKVEVFNANLHKELFNVQRFHDVTQMKRRLETHLHWYNHARTHHALGGLLVPADRYYGRVEEVLARIEAGSLREGDELGLRERCLEMFKVVSRGGVPEVWLLGRQLMPLVPSTTL